MPFKDPEKLRAYQKQYSSKWYSRNAEKQKAKSRQRKRELRKWYDDIKSKTFCVSCGISGKENTWMMEFHHRDENTKDKSLSYMISNGYGKESCLEEMKKCDILCANCHRKLHYERKKIRDS
tara:strand:+ start:60 stop:425 length:366 start_codon:yes stop_codon:yes gene_type:complete